MKKRLIALLLIALLACGSLVACTTPAAPADNGTKEAEAEPAGEEEAEPAGEEAEPAGEEAEPAGDDEITSEPIEFTWLHHLQEEGKQAWVQHCVDVFTAEHPNVTINIEILTADQYSTMVKTKAASGDAPMIFDADTTTFPEYVAAGYCADVTDVSDYANFPADTLGQGIVDGKVYGVPLDVNAYCIFYNKDLFAELGLEVPTTNSELIEVCDKLVEAGVQPFSGGFAEQWCERIFVNNYSDPATVMLNPKWYEEKMDGTSNFADDEAWKSAMETFVSYKKYWGDDPFAVTWSDVQNDLATGKAAMTMNGSWIISGVASINPDFNMGAFPVPRTEDPADNKMIIKPGNNFCVFNTDDEELLKVAKAFFKYMCSTESAEFYAVSASGLTGAIVDVDAGPCINEINSYTGDAQYVQAGITTLTSEYNSVYQDIMAQQTNQDEIDVQAWAEALDEGFATIQ